MVEVGLTQPQVDALGASAFLDDSDLRSLVREAVVQFVETATPTRTSTTCCAIAAQTRGTVFAAPARPARSVLTVHPPRCFR